MNNRLFLLTGLLRPQLLVLLLVQFLWAPGLLAAPVVVTDFAGREVRLEQPARRIIALAPHIVENVYSAGAGEHLVAAVNYSDYPAAARKLPQLGSYNAVSLEQILARKPDLVLVWASGNGETIVHQLQRLGITVYVDEPRQLQDVARSVRDIGILSGTEKHSEVAAGQYLKTLAAFEKNYSDAQEVSVFYQVWNEPLQTLNDEHLVSDVIRLCGGRNIYADASVIAPKINIESVLQRNPDVIVASGMDEERPEWLEEWRKWSKLTAVAEDNLFFVPPDLIQRHTLRILEGAKLFCAHLQSARAKAIKTTE